MQADEDDGGIPCYPGELVCQLKKTEDNNNSGSGKHKGGAQGECKTVKCEAQSGDLLAWLDFWTPTNIGWSLQGSGSVGAFLGPAGNFDIYVSSMH
jgi:hypothetical protein